MKLITYLNTYSLTRREFARMTGLCEATIRNILRGRNAAWNTICRIEHATNKNVSRYDLHSEAYQMWPLMKE